MGKWYARPVWIVADVSASIDFYVNKLGFTEKWRFDSVAQVNRDECEIIVCNHWPEKKGTGVAFLELTTDDYAALPGELAARGVAAKKGWWGYRAWIVTDLDGNEIIFADPDDPGGGSPS